MASGARSVAFCCISTGMFGYPQEAAAQVALRSLRAWYAAPGHRDRLDYAVLNVFLPKDLQIYTRLLPDYFRDGAVPERGSE